RDRRRLIVVVTTSSTPRISSRPAGTVRPIWLPAIGRPVIPASRSRAHNWPRPAHRDPVTALAGWALAKGARERQALSCVGARTASCAGGAWFAARWAIAFRGRRPRCSPGGGDAGGPGCRIPADAVDGDRPTVLIDEGAVGYAKGLPLLGAGLSRWLRFI